MDTSGKEVGSNFIVVFKVKNCATTQNIVVTIDITTGTC